MPLNTHFSSDDDDAGSHRAPRLLKLVGNKQHQHQTQRYVNVPSGDDSACGTEEQIQYTTIYMIIGAIP